MGSDEIQTPKALTLSVTQFTAPFNSMQNPKSKAQPAKAFFATVNQMFGGSSQLPTTAEHCSVVWIVLNDLITTRSAVFGSWEEPPNIWLTVAQKAFLGWALNFRVRMLLKGAVNTHTVHSDSQIWCVAKSATKISTFWPKHRNPCNKKPLRQ